MTEPHIHVYDPRTMRCVVCDKLWERQASEVDHPAWEPERPAWEPPADVDPVEHETFL